MKIKIFTLYLTLVFSLPSYACSCILIESFCETITFNDGNIDPNLLIILGKKKSNTGSGMKVDVLDVLHGTESNTQITVRKGNGADCGVNTDRFENGEELVMALWGGEQQGEIIYNLSICGITFLEVDNGIVKGAIAPGIRNLAYEDLKTLSDCGTLTPGFFDLETVFFPNPVSEQANFFIDANAPINISANVFDTKGSLVGKNRIQLDEFNQTGHIPTKQLPNGVYFVEFSVLSSRKTYKLVVSH